MFHMLKHWKFKRTCGTNHLSDKITAFSQVHVLGVLESSGIPLIICDHWNGRTAMPPPPKSNPFVPFHLQQKLSMPHATAEREWLFCQNIVSRWLHSTSTELIFSYCREHEGETIAPAR